MGPCFHNKMQRKSCYPWKDNNSNHDTYSLLWFERKPRLDSSIAPSAKQKTFLVILWTTQWKTDSRVTVVLDHKCEYFLYSVIMWDSCIRV